MALKLPPVSIPFIADLSRLVQGARQIEQVVNQAATARTVRVDVDTAQATRSTAELVGQMRALDAEIRSSAGAIAQGRQNIAALVAEQARLRAAMAATANEMRQQGASAREIQAALGQARVQFQMVGASIAEQRRELVSAQAAQQQYRNALSQTRDALRQVEQGEGAAAAETKKFTAEIRNAGQEAQRSKTFFDGLKSAFALGGAFGAGAAIGGKVANLGLDAIGKGFAFAKDAAIGFNSSLEQSRIAFATFLGGARQADRFLADLQKYAVATPFEFPQLIEASKRMLAFGFSAQQVMPLLTAVGNATAALGSGSVGLDRITLALGQMQAKGRVSGEELRQLQEAGIKTGDIFAIIAEQTGATTQQLQEMAEKGQLSSTLFIAAFEKWSQQRFGDMMARQSQTFQGAMSNIRDAATQVLARIGAPFFAALSRAAQAVATFAQTDTFQRWADIAAAAAQRVMAILATVGGVALQVARAVASAFGVQLPSFDFSGVQQQAAQAAQQQTQATQQTASAQAELVRQGLAYTKQITDAEAAIKKIDTALDGLRDKQDGLRNQIDDIKQGYEDQITPLERQLAAINRLTDADRARQSRLNELEGQEIQVRLATPDTSGLDATIEKLKRDKEDLGKLDTSGWDTPLARLRDQLQAIAREDTSELTNRMRAAQEALYQLGKENTDGLDREIRGLREKIDSISDAAIKGIDKQVEGLQARLKALNTDDLDRQIDALNAKLNQPAPDTTGLSNQLVVAAAQIQTGGGAAARATFASLSAQKAGILSNYQTAQTGIKGQIAALEAERAARRLANADEKTAIQTQIDGLTGQKTAIQERNAEVKAGYEAEIKNLERVKQGRQDDIERRRRALQDSLHGMELEKQAGDDDRERRRRAIQEQIDGIEEAKKSAQAAHQERVDQLDQQIRMAERQKEDLLAPSKEALARIDREKTIIGLQQQQADLARKIAAAPLKERIDALKLAEEDALDPLNRQLAMLEKQSRELESQKRKWDAIKGAAEDAAKAIDFKGGGAGAGPNGTGVPTPAALGKGETAVANAGPQSGLLTWLDDLDKKVKAVVGSDEWSVIFNGTHKDGSPVSTEDRWTTLGAVAVGALNNLDARLKRWVADHASETWYVLLFGERPMPKDQAGPPTPVGLEGQLDLANEALKRHVGWWGTYTDFMDKHVQPIYSWLGGKAVELVQTHQRAWKDWTDFSDQHIQPTYDRLGEKAKEIFGAGGKIGQYFSQTGKDVQQMGKDFGAVFGEGGKVGQFFDWLGGKTNKLFGPGGFIGQYFSQTGTDIRQMEKDFGDTFGEGGHIGQFFSWLGGSIKGLFEGGGTIGTYFSSFGAWAQTNVVDKLGGWFGENGTIGGFFSSLGSSVQSWFGGENGGVIGGKFSAFGTFLNGIFGADGSISKMFGGLGGILTSALNLAVTPLNLFMAAIAQTVRGIGDFFHVDALSKMPTPSITFGDGAAVGGSAPTFAPNGIANSADGQKDFRGGWSWVGERGAELMYVPQHATIVPHEQSKQMAGGFPGFAEGLNLGNLFTGAVSLVGDALGLAQRGAQAVLDRVGGNLIAAPDLPFPGLGDAMAKVAKDGALNLIKEGLSRITGLFSGGRPGTRGGSGFSDMKLADFLTYMAGYGGPVDTESAFNDIIGAARDNNIDPRWLMAVMQTETQYGNTAGRLKSVWNFGGMGVNNRGFGFDSGVQATDSSMHFAGYNSLKDFLEDVGQWIAQNGTSFVSYDGSGVEKNEVYQRLLAAIPGSASSIGPVQGGDGFMMPVNGEITQGWGRTPFAVSSGFYRNNSHDGVDIGVPMRTPVVADGSGLVSNAGWSGIGYGQWVKILTENFETWTGHMDSVVANVGDMVRKGQLVGYSGNSTETGATTGPHVHWGAHRDGQSIDPFTLPGLATGGIVRREGVYRLAEGDRAEAVIPLTGDGLPRNYRDRDSRSFGDDAPIAVTVTFEKGAVAVDRDGTVRVNEDKMTFTRARRRSGIQG